MVDWLQFLAQRGQGVAVARGSGVGRDAERLGDLFKGELVPDLEHEDLALFAGQPVQGGLDFPAALGGLAQLRLEECLALFQAAVGFLLADRAAGLPPGVIDGRAADGSDEQGLRVARELPLVAPVAHEGFLHHVLGIGERAGPLAAQSSSLGP